MNAAKTSAQRQAEMKTRRAAEGIKKIPNLWAHEDDHDTIREFAAKLARKRQRAKPAL